MKCVEEKITDETWSTHYQKKVIDPAKLASLCAQIRYEGCTIATLNGSFDILHAGHLHMIFEASQAADCLLVALNTDQSIRAYKSPDRPVIPLEYRLQMMAALGFVDYVTWFDETDPRRILSIIQPDVHVNGAEYGDQCIEAQTVLAHGGRLKIIQLIPGLSTTQIIQKIQSLPVSTGCGA